MVMLELFNFLHFIGLVFGLGGATIATIISIKADKDKDIAKAFGKIIPTISKLIWIGLILLIISGIALPFYITWPLNKQLLIIKHVLVAWIVVIGISIGITAKKVSVLAPVGKENPSIYFLKIKKLMKSLSIINIILWYLVTLMSAFV
jgi:uncharacterized membrane protein